MFESYTGIIGSSSVLGQQLIHHLNEKGVPIKTFSRQNKEQSELIHDEVIPFWICLAPIWVIPDYFNMLIRYKIKKIVVLSSTSRFTKIQSSNRDERDIAQKLLALEDKLQTWAEQNKIDWVILRPTLIYCYGKDKNKNISEITNFIKRFNVFPILGSGDGLRQPIYVDDVVKACIGALESSRACRKAYNISGGET